MGFITRSVFKLTKVGIKFGAVGGTAYFLHQKNVFGTNTQPDKIMKSIADDIPAEVVQAHDEYVKPLLSSVPELPALPKGDLATRWNSAVFATFHFLSSLPQHTVNTAEYIVDSIKTLSAGTQESESDEQQ